MVDSKSVDNALAWFPEWGCWCLTTSLSVWACLCDVGFYFLVLSTVRWNLNDVQKRQKLNFMENLTTGLVFMIVVVNIFITAIGVHRPNHSNWPNTRRCLVFSPFMFTLFECSPLFKQTSIFSDPLWALGSNRHTCSQHVLGTSSLDLHKTSYLTYKHTDPSRLPEKFPPENNQKAENPFLACKKETSAVTKGVWYVNSTTFVSAGGQTGK